MEKFKIKYEIEDGYVGGSRPQYVTLDESDFCDCETQEDVEEVIQNAVEEDFRNRAYACADEGQVSIEEILELRKEEEEGE